MMNFSKIFFSLLIALDYDVSAFFVHENIYPLHVIECLRNNIKCVEDKYKYLMLIVRLVIFLYKIGKLGESITF